MQRWIANEAPVIEERIQRTTLQSAVTFLKSIVIAIEFAQSHLARSPEYRIRLQLAKIPHGVSLSLCGSQFAPLKPHTLPPKVTAALNTIFALN